MKETGSWRSPGVEWPFDPLRDTTTDTDIRVGHGLQVGFHLAEA